MNVLHRKHMGECWSLSDAACVLIMNGWIPDDKCILNRVNWHSFKALLVSHVRGFSVGDVG